MTVVRAAWGVKSCALSVCCAVPNQDVCQLHNALEALNQPQDVGSTFA